MPTVLACLRRSVERMWPRRVPTRFGPATRLRRPKNQWDQGPLATQQAEMCPRTANSGKDAVAEVGLGRAAQGLVLVGACPLAVAAQLQDAGLDLGQGGHAEPEVGPVAPDPGDEVARARVPPGVEPRDDVGVEQV